MGGGGGGGGAFIRVYGIWKMIFTHKTSVFVYYVHSNCLFGGTVFVNNG